MQCNEKRINLLMGINVPPQVKCGDDPSSIRGSAVIKLCRHEEELIRNQFCVFGAKERHLATVKFVHDPPGGPQPQRGYLISVGWPHYAHGGSVLTRVCNNIDDLRREVGQLKAELDAALANGENFFNQ